MLERGDKLEKGSWGEGVGWGEVNVEMGGFPPHTVKLQKMLTALFNLDLFNLKWTIFFDCPSKVFLSIENVLEKISEDQP